MQDRVGIHAPRLPDLRCHFEQLDPSDVANVLCGLSAYTVEQGDVLQDRNTTSGISDADQWRCQHEMAILAPERTVLDVDIDIGTGRRHAAGERRRGSWSSRLRGRSNS